MNTTNAERGDQFEREVEILLNLQPGTSVQRQVSVNGKLVDFLCKEMSGFGITRIIAVETKNYSRPMRREEVAQMVYDYAPLLENGDVDLFLLVTANGIVPNAKLMLTRKIIHQTKEELFRNVFPCQTLLTNMQLVFAAAELSKQYVASKTSQIDIDFISKYYDLTYNSFIDFAIEIRFFSYFDPDHKLAKTRFEKLKTSWKQLNQSPDQKALCERYSYDSLREIVSKRSGGAPTDLLKTVENWASNQNIKQGIALLGSYGTGKSSFAKKFAATLATQYVQGKSSRIPILIELRDFADHQTIEGLITHELVNKHHIPNGSFATFSALNAAGKFLIILDGFDEMKFGMSSEALLYNFQQIADLHRGNSKLLLCGRPTIFDSEAEQTRMLSADGPDSSGKYIQIDILPFEISDSINLIEALSRSKQVLTKKELSERISQIKKRAKQDREFLELLSRPVHVPMLVSVLPNRSINIETLTRPRLFEAFVTRIIEQTLDRESRKAKSAELVAYNTKERQEFATQIAVLMFQSGATRSIRYSEIPEELFKRHRKAGMSLDAARRGLLASCFLERKPPDILFFAHKSFGEYLVSDFVCEYLVDKKLETDVLKLKFTPEITEFIFEMLPAENLAGILDDPRGHLNFFCAIERLIPKSNSLERHLQSLMARQEFGLDWARTFSSSSDWKAVYHAVEFLERLSKQNVQLLKPTFIKFLSNACAHSDDVPAVHAYRLLSRIDADCLAMAQKALTSGRLVSWRKNGWLGPVEI